jgi:hypothetical protein
MGSLLQSYCSWVVCGKPDSYCVYSIKMLYLIILIVKLFIYEVKVNVKVQFPLEQATKAQGGGEQWYSSTFSVTSTLDGDGCLTSRPGCFNAGKTRYPLYRDWVDPTVRLDGCAKSRHHRNSIHGSSSPQRLSYPCPHMW